VCFKNCDILQKKGVFRKRRFQFMHEIDNLDFFKIIFMVSSFLDESLAPTLVQNCRHLPNNPGVIPNYGFIHIG